ncbi:DUF3348 domain-containing protein [Pararobbsia silviterrae]|uniref:DUF3348 family protein n=1 Tax=Pararobbsia silviterrae TaxID=1792498 RepID=A0A494XIM5_9BURK|nr:DUF3348 domain-containing protein [Pararobbsia silviterrae]RKP49612.1 DUF3348 family protein [Pararobbsia silviterrae]
MQASSRTVFSGPALVRLLARIASAEVHESGQSVFERLSEWLSWTDAIALSNALDGAPPAAASRARAAGQSAAHDAQDAACAEVRASLARAIADDRVFDMFGRGVSTPTPAFARAASRAPSVSTDAPIDFGVIRQHYVSMQQHMEAKIAELRDRLRRRLATCSESSARLAALDLTMDRAFGERERSLFGAVPTVLEGHFKRLQRAEHDALSDPHALSDAAKPTPGAWLDVFRQDMQSALLAELAIRFQPLEGLLAALRTR